MYVGIIFFYMKTLILERCATIFMINGFRNFEEWKSERNRNKSDTSVVS